MTTQATLLSLIGHTPIVQLKRLHTGCCDLFVKCENLNPGGSIKDRTALYMVEALERKGLLKPGGTIIEATAGNTGLGLALVAAIKGYKLVLVIPDKMSQEKIFHLKATGAEVILTRSDVHKGHPEYYQDYAANLAKKLDNAVYINQFGNESNPLSHETWTAPELWEQMEHNIDAIVCGAGTGGTITGIGRYMEKVSPQTEMILADPQGSTLCHFVETGDLKDTSTWLVEGIGGDYVPAICDLSRVKKAYSVTDQEAFLTVRELLLNEGIYAGSSTGVLVAAALKYCLQQTEPKRVLTFVCDGGAKYQSKMFNDYWMLDQGFMQGEQLGDLRDLVVRKHLNRATITIGPEETLLVALKKMKLYDVSQLPVLLDDKIVGILDESDILYRITRSDLKFKDLVKNAMSPNLELIDYRASIEKLIDLFEKNMVAIVMDKDQFLGIITRIDLLNYLRQKTDGNGQ